MAALDNRCSGCFRPSVGTEPCPHCGYEESTHNASHQLPIGTVLKEQYQIGMVLGQGGFGITYLGWDLYLDIPVAIKEYYPSGMVMRDCAATLSVTDVSGDDGKRFHNNRDRFMREAKMLARFSQVPEVVQVKNFFLANNTAYIVMEYVEGITLKQFVKDQGGKLCAEDTLHVLGPVVRTMAKIHKTGIVHRDISPDNIMMLPGGGAKVLDFGAVRSVDSSQIGKELTKSTEAILKQGYAPIEQYQKKGALGPWTDVYALCATIYYCLTGEVPPDAPARVLGYEEMDISLTGLNEKQQTALMRGMAIRVEDRLHSMEELYNALFGEETTASEAAEVSVEIPALPEKKLSPAAPAQSGKEPELRTAQVNGTGYPVVQDPPTREERSQVRSVSVAVDAGKTLAEEQTEKQQEKNKTDSKKWIPLVIGAIALIAAIGVGFSLFGGKRTQIPEDTTAATQAQPQIVHSFVIPGHNVYWTLYDDGVMVLTGTGDIPDHWDGWDDYKMLVQSVRLKGVITKIGEGAFRGCKNLKQVDLGGYVKQIGDFAFCDTGLTELTIPETLSYIGHSAFRNTALTGVVIPDSVEFLGNQAFALCENLTDVTIGPNTRLCYDAVNDVNADPIFCGAEGVIREDFVIHGPSGGIVEDYAQLYGYKLNVVSKSGAEGRGVVNDDITWWFDRETGFLKLDGEGWLGSFGGSHVFYGDLRFYNDNVIPWEKYRDEVKVVSIGDGIWGSVSANLFENHRNLDDVYFGKQIENIDPYAFARTNIDVLHLPDTILDIQPLAFDHCENLRSLVVPLSMWGLEPGSFNQCVNLEELFIAGWIREEYNSTYNAFTSREKGEYTMPQNLVIYTAGQHSEAVAFAEKHGYELRQGLDGIAWEEPMGHAGGRVYWRLEGDTLILFGVGDTGFFYSNANVLNAWHDNVYQWFTSDDSEFYPYRNEIRHIVVQPGVTRLNKGIFKDMPNLETVDFGTVEALYSEAFVNCGMELLALPDTLHTISDRAIVACTNLRQIDIHNGENRIGDSAFDGCSVLRSVFIYSDAIPSRNFLKGTEDVMLIGSENKLGAFAWENGIPYSALTNMG